MPTSWSDVRKFNRFNLTYFSFVVLTRLGLAGAKGTQSDGMDASSGDTEERPWPSTEATPHISTRE